MYRKVTDISKLYEKELTRLDEFKKQNPNKDVNVYFNTYDTGGIGFNLIATTDKPKLEGKYSCDYGNSIDITDYDIRIDEF